MKESKRNKKLQVRIDEYRLNAFSAYSINHGTKMSRIIINYINELLQADNNKINRIEWKK